MPVSLYEITVPVFIRYLNILSDLLSKGQAYADEQYVFHSPSFSCLDLPGSSETQLPTFVLQKHSP